MLGRLSDSVGRVHMLKLSALGSILGALGSLHATGKWSFIAARLVSPALLLAGTAGFSVLLFQDYDVFSFPPALPPFFSLHGVKRSLVRYTSLPDLQEVLCAPRSSVSLTSMIHTPWPKISPAETMSNSRRLIFESPPERWHFVSHTREGFLPL